MSRVARAVVGSHSFGWRFWLWTAIFIGGTLDMIAFEVTASFDKSDNTQPWTWYISHYVPWPIALGAYVALVAWLPFHFWYHYRRQSAATRVVLDGSPLPSHEGVHIEYGGERGTGSGMVELIDVTISGDPDKVRTFVRWMVTNER